MTGARTTRQITALCAACGHRWLFCTLPVPADAMPRMLRHSWCPVCNAGHEQIKVRGTQPGDFQQIDEDTNP